MSTWREPRPACWLLKIETLVMQIKGPDLKTLRLGTGFFWPRRICISSRIICQRNSCLRYIGPFKILKKVGTQAYELELPPTMKMHDVFHVSLLKTYHEDGSHQPPPVTILMDGEQEHEVERILDHRQEGRRSKSYLVRWTGYGPEHDTWEPETALQNCRSTVQSYWGEQRQTP